MFGQKKVNQGHGTCPWRFLEWITWKGYLWAISGPTLAIFKYLSLYSSEFASLTDLTVYPPETYAWNINNHLKQKLFFDQ